jgi:putative transposase
MKAEQRLEVLRQLEKPGVNKTQMLKKLDLPQSTYYHWRELLESGGVPALEREAPLAKRIWSRLLPEEEQQIVAAAKAHPELSPRLLALRITDSDGIYVSESKVFSLLKSYGLIAPRPMPEFPASKEYRRKTTKPNEMWQIDGTNFFIVDWGYYKLIPVIDDFSRKGLSWRLFPDEDAESASHAIEEAAENAKIKDLPKDEKPILLSDNGGAFKSGVLDEHLSNHGIRHIFGKPYHPQTQGKIERLNKRIKEKVCLMVYTSPGELQKAIDEFFETYNATPHEGLKNVSPNDVYDGKRDEVLARRAEIKRRTLERRKKYNLGRPKAS